MSTDQITAFLERLSDAELVSAIRQGLAMQKERFATANKQRIAEQKRMTAEAISGRKPKEKKNAVSQAA